MKMKDIRLETSDKVESDLLALLNTQFNLRMQAASKELKQTHLLRNVRKDIARFKTILNEKKGKSHGRK
jgi:large subunit ribosomal protein L29